DVAVRQEHLLFGVVQLLDAALGDVGLIFRTARLGAVAQACVDQRGQLAVLVRMRGVVVVEFHAEGDEVGRVADADAGDERLRRHAGLFSGQHDWRAMRIVGANVGHLVAHHALRPHPDVGLDITQQMTHVQRTVGVRQGVGDEQAATHGGLALRGTAHYGIHGPPRVCSLQPWKPAVQRVVFAEPHAARNLPMVDTTRRTFLLSGIGLAGSCLLPRASWATGIGSGADGRPMLPTHGGESPVAPREQWLLDFDCRLAFGNGCDPAKDFGYGFGQGDFSKTGDFKIATSEFDDAGWRALDLPHDWAVELAPVHDDSGDDDTRLTSHGYKPLGRRYPATSVGWYRRTFELPASDRGRRSWLEFDGAMRDVVLLVNGCFIGRHDDGYTPFRFDLTDFLNYGGKNVIALRVDASFGDGWFYEGAGIYRHVWLTKLDHVHLGRWESVVRSTVEGNAAKLDLASVVQNESEHAVHAALEWLITDASGRVVAQATTPAQAIAPGASADCKATARIDAPSLWSPDEPHLYTALVKVVVDGATRDAEQFPFGIRTASFDPDRGFFLNGKPLKIQGTCNHQDHAGVGAALPDRLQAFRVGVLQGMGCNAVRTSHNMPTPEWVEACDR